MQAGNFRDGFFCAPLFFQKRYAIIDAYAWLIVFARERLCLGAPLFRVFIEPLNAIPAIIGNCSNTLERHVWPSVIVWQFRPSTGIRRLPRLAWLRDENPIVQPFWRFQFFSYQRGGCHTSR